MNARDHAVAIKNALVNGGCFHGNRHGVAFCERCELVVIEAMVEVALEEARTAGASAGRVEALAQALDLERRRS